MFPVVKIQMFTMYTFPVIQLHSTGANMKSTAEYSMSTDLCSVVHIHLTVYIHPGRNIIVISCIGICSSPLY